MICITTAEHNIVFQHIDSFNKTNVRNSYFTNPKWILEQSRLSAITCTIRLYRDCMGDHMLYPFTHLFSLDRLHALKINTLNQLAWHSSDRHSWIRDGQVVLACWFSNSNQLARELPITVFFSQMKELFMLNFMAPLTL